MERAMRRALELAGSRNPHPNPRVGAVMLDASGAVVGEGWHVGPGAPHAEVVALEEAGRRSAGGTLVVTLEPCSHHGRTPPCTDAIVAAGVKAVVVGAIDPDPLVSGRGVARLESEGISVSAGLLEDDIVAADLAYFHHRRTGLPLFHLKMAATLDGQTAASDGSSQWITSPEARRDAHRLRASADAVMVGAGTVIADDPRLSVRHGISRGRQPRPVVVAGSRGLPPTAAVLERDPLVYAPRPLDVAAEVVVVPGAGSRVDLEGAAKDMADRGLLGVLVEGGPTLAASLIESGLVSRVTAYFGALLAGGVGGPMLTGTWETLTAGHELRYEQATLVGGSVRIDARVAS